MKYLFDCLDVRVFKNRHRTSFDASDASLHPNPPFYFKSCQVLQHTFETHDARILFAHGGGAPPPPPPQPPALFQIVLDLLQSIRIF